MVFNSDNTAVGSELVGIIVTTFHSNTLN